VRHGDDVVERARALHAAGESHAAIGAALGAPRSTVQHWCARTRRNAVPVRVIATTRPTKGSKP
jgi:hypothetical protein